MCYNVCPILSSLSYFEGVGARSMWNWYKTPPCLTSQNYECTGLMKKVIFIDMSKLFDTLYYGISLFIYLIILSVRQTLYIGSETIHLMVNNVYVQMILISGAFTHHIGLWRMWSVSYLLSPDQFYIPYPQILHI